MLHYSAGANPIRSHAVDLDSGSLTERDASAEQIEAELDEAFLRWRPQPSDEAAEAAARVAPEGVQGFGSVSFDDGNGVAGFYWVGSDIDATLVVAWHGYAEAMVVPAEIMAGLNPQWWDAVLLPEGGDE